MASLDKDGIQQPIIVGSEIMIPIGDTIYTGKLELNFEEMIFFAQSVFLSSMSESESVAYSLQSIEKISAKFTPAGIFNGLTDMDNVSWIMQQWITAYTDLKKSETE